MGRSNCEVSTMAKPNVPALDKLKELLAAVKEKFSSDGDAAEDLEKFEANPERYRPVIEDILEEKLAEDAEFATRTSDLVNEIGLDVIQIIEEATSMTGVKAKKLRKGKVRVVQRVTKANDVTGADIDEIG